MWTLRISQWSFESWQVESFLTTICLCNLDYFSLVTECSTLVHEKRWSFHDSFPNSFNRNDVLILWILIILIYLHLRPFTSWRSKCSSVRAWRIPGTVEPDGLPSRVAQSWTRLKRLNSSSSNLCYSCFYSFFFFLFFLYFSLLGMLFIFILI